MGPPVFVLMRSLMSVFAYSIICICSIILLMVPFLNYDTPSHHLLILQAHRKGYSLQICRRFQASQHQHHKGEGGEPAQPVSPSQPLPAAELRKWRGKSILIITFQLSYLKFVVNHLHTYEENVWEAHLPGPSHLWQRWQLWLQLCAVFHCPPGLACGSSELSSVCWCQMPQLKSPPKEEIQHRL